MERQGTNERPDPDTTPPGVRVTGEGKVVDGFHKIAEPRQTGRTTQLLKEAVKKLEEGKNVVFVIKLWSDITHVQHMLDKAGLLPGLNLTQSGRYTHKDGNTLTIISLSDATSMCFKEREACVIYDHTIDLNDRATEKTELPKEANEIKQQYCDVVITWIAGEPTVIQDCFMEGFVHEGTGFHLMHTLMLKDSRSLTYLLNRHEIRMLSISPPRSLTHAEEKKQRIEALKGLQVTQPSPEDRRIEKRWQDNYLVCSKCHDVPEFGHKSFVCEKCHEQTLGWQKILEEDFLCLKCAHEQKTCKCRRTFSDETFTCHASPDGKTGWLPKEKTL